METPIYIIHWMFSNEIGVFCGTTIHFAVKRRKMFYAFVSQTMNFYLETFVRIFGFSTVVKVIAINKRNGFRYGYAIN